MTETRLSELMPIVLETLAAEPVRFDNIRSGEREPIDLGLRRLIYKRDRYRCRHCGKTGQLLELDHIIPWSNGGSDRSDNLRSMCRDCNTLRSNYVTDAPLESVRSVVEKCTPCLDRLAFEVDADVRITVFCGWRNHVSWTNQRGSIL